ncbi:hypothetical protein JOF48_000349 [Arthrobacter stackebrandtii]|uniref:Capsular polysaccharide biosynthesis protein n=1 Tax=Arthrobacter stackebrandtii TaxID=272161 RepID=A0ABS4YRZ2_9MICC|nr:hypothetical protein [Arthrobacter stackebrandtii]MBP2411550.1 hypothetical protein [Arthrobacter stackebrandtii]PYG99230.1 hypothetical protein CVV67_16015 [Arthrobacter stackebrandtii]
MFLQDLGKGLLRRWYMVVLGLGLTLYGAYMVYGVVPLTYKATASIVLVPPATAVVEGENPYLYMGGLDQAMSVLVVKMNSEAISTPLTHKQPGTTYSLDRDISTTGPIMLLTTESTSEASTLRLLNNVIKVIPDNLKTLQDQLKIPDNARISSMNIASDHEAKPQNKDRIRMTLMTVAAGGAATVLLTGLVDRMLMARRRRRPPRIKKQKAGRKPPMDGQNPVNLQQGEVTAAPPSKAATKAAANSAGKAGKAASPAKQAPGADAPATPAPAPLAADAGTALARRG